MIVRRLAYHSVFFGALVVFPATTALATSPPEPSSQAKPNPKLHRDQPHAGTNVVPASGVPAIPHEGHLAPDAPPISHGIRIDPTHPWPRF